MMVLRDNAQLQNLVLMQLVMAKACLEKTVLVAHAVEVVRFSAWYFR